jgi:hypothetical protein
MVILGVVLLATAIFFTGSVGTSLRLCPTPILGVILFLTSAQLALGSCDISEDKGERFVTVIHRRAGRLERWYRLCGRDGGLDAQQARVAAHLRLQAPCCVERDRLRVDLPPNVPTFSATLTTVAY